jgi:tetratricopeptide (TPR) repeat protein
MISGGTMHRNACSPMTGWTALTVSLVLLLFASPVKSGGLKTDSQQTKPTNTINSTHSTNVRLSRATKEIIIDPERQFQFAEYYFKQGEYYRAIGEYERFIYFYPSSDKIERARFKIGLCFLHGEQYAEAIKSFDELIADYKNTEYALKSYITKSKAYARLKRYDAALTGIKNLITVAPSQQIRDKAYYEGGWIYLEMGLWEKAQEFFDKISVKNREKYHLRTMVMELDKKLPLKRKNPMLAGFLAVLPGAGHLYCERKKDALISFLLNGAMIWGAYEAFDHDLNVIGGIITFFELGFYSGNIYSAVSSAHKYNRNKKYIFLDYLKNTTKARISLANPHKNKSLLITCRFLF